MKRLAKVLIILAVVYAIGFGAFLAALPTPRLGVPAIGGLVVFTGGSNRVPMAVDALAQGYTGPVLISGVNPQVKLHDLAPDLPPGVARQIELDTAALTTRQNVDNTAAWAQRHGLYEVGVITSTYHAVRVKLLFAWRAPGLRVRLIAVQPTDAGLRAMLREYNKLLAAPFVAQLSS